MFLGYNFFVFYSSYRKTGNRIYASHNQSFDLRRAACERITPQPGDEFIYAVENRDSSRLSSVISE